MNFYDKTAYNTRYRMVFADIENQQWTVDIEQPYYTGEITMLKAAANPLEWDGQGDDSQTDCLLGSTGYIRLLCMEGQEGVFSIGGIRPSEINDRRVTVKRGNTTMWIGFLSIEEYEQPIESTPYEVELPIKSVVACLEDFTLPPYEDFEEPCDTFSLLQYVVKLTGANVVDIVTNIAEYEDFYGKKIQSTTTTNRHWTEAQVVITYWYGRGEHGYTPKSLKDVIESILYPYGHLREYGNSWGIFMPASAESSYNNKLYMMSTDPNVSSGNRLSDTGRTIGNYNMKSLIPTSTGNRTSVIEAPSNVTYKRDIKSESGIFELKSSMIKSSYSPTIETCITKDYNARKRYISKIHQSSIETYFIREADFQGDCSFCRVVDVTKKDGVNEYTYDDVNQLALYFHGVSKIEMKMMDEVRSRAGYNLIKLSISEHKLSSSSPDATTSPISQVKVKDKGKYLTQSGTWTSVENWIETKNLHKNGSEYYILFNEPRDSGDNSPHKLKLFFRNETGSETIWIEPNLEYVEDSVFTESHVLRNLRKGTQYNEITVLPPFGGEIIKVDFKTMCGQTFDGIDGAANIPFCGFCDKVGLIDVQPRKQVVFDKVKYSAADPLHLVRNYVLIKDGSMTYIPQAVGCNARECEMKLKLIQTTI